MSAFALRLPQPGRKADTIVNNHRAILFGPGLSCERTLTYLARMLGDQAVTQRSATPGESGRRSVTEGTHYRPLAAADELRPRSNPVCRDRDPMSAGRILD